MNLDSLNIITPQEQQTLLASPDQTQSVTIDPQAQLFLADADGFAPEQTEFVRADDDLWLTEEGQTAFVVDDYFAQDNPAPLHGVGHDGQHYEYRLNKDNVTTDTPVTAKSVATPTQPPSDWVLPGLVALGLLSFAGFSRGGSDHESSSETLGNTTSDKTLPNNAGAVTIAGTPEVGAVLSASVKDADGLPATVAYQWLADGKPISGATNSTFALTHSEAGKAVSVKVNYADDAGFQEALTSAPTPAITDNTPLSNNTGVVTIAGTPEVGALLSASVKDADGLPATVAYQWLADGKPITGATNNTFTLTRDEAGKAVSVKINYTDSAGFQEALTSEITAEVIDQSGTGIYVPKPLTDLVIDVTDAGYDAKGDGTTNDTTAIQKAIDAVADAGGGVVWIPKGRYMIDTEARLKMRSNVTVQMTDDTVLEAIPNGAGSYSIFRFYNVENAHLLGGTLVGDRDSHLGTSGEWGTGVNISSSSNIRVENIVTKDFWGDGFYIGENGSLDKSENIVLYNVVGDNNRRQGLTIVNGDNIKIIDSTFQNTHGTAPAAGICIEPNDNNLVSNVEILNCKTINNDGDGIGLYERVNAINNEIENVRVDGNEIIGNSGGIIVSGSVTDSTITNNFINTMETDSSEPGIRLYYDSINNTVTDNTVLYHGEHKAVRIDNQDLTINTVLRNVIAGNDEDNHLTGSVGSDILIGGKGADIFLFQGNLSDKNIDKITDFSSGQGDKIALSEAIFGKLEGDWFAAQGEQINTETRIIQQGDNLYYDADGSGSAYSLVQFATIDETVLKEYNFITINPL
ncbi:MAG: hypothetical protein CR975_02940 [Gammaproteobacteria bacterium]|nr:MAG: hypothetical protein CR975_02940 [Gammaproteobacteria bacterium]